MAKTSTSSLRVTGLKVSTAGMLQGTFFALLGLAVAISSSISTIIKFLSTKKNNVNNYLFCFLLLFIHQRFLIRMLIIWACLSGGYYVLNSWFIADYANSTISTIILTLILIRSENSKLLRSFTQPST